MTCYYLFRIYVLYFIILRMRVLLWILLQRTGIFSLQRWKGTTVKPLKFTISSLMHGALRTFAQYDKFNPSNQNRRKGDDSPVIFAADIRWYTGGLRGVLPAILATRFIGVLPVESAADNDSNTTVFYLHIFGIPYLKLNSNNISQCV